jgi:hypothetical protein
MKQIWPNYSYSPATNVLTLTGLNIDRDQLLLVTAADRGRIMYNFADSSVIASAFTSGANTALTLVATTAGLTTTAALVIYYDDQLASTTVTVSSLPAISGTVTVGNPISIQSGNITIEEAFGQDSFMPISGTVTANVAGNLNNTIEFYDESNPQYVVGVHIKDLAGNVIGTSVAPMPISGTVTIGSALPAGTAQIGSVTASISGTVPISISSVTVGNSVTIGSFATSVTARLINPAGTAVTYAEVGTAGSPSIDVLSVQGVSGGTSLLIGGTTGSFTTRFGSVTTANTAQISTAVTNLSRKYLFVQNVTTSSNVITVGIGFTPTTTQGIQLAAGALIDFQSSFIPTGAVYILSSVTGSPFTILEA